ncbi:MAG: DUF5801 repeats-in-toxin domain-containing protein, partial [Sphingomicrobium sp.]
MFTGHFGADGFKDSDNNDIEDADAIRYSLSITGGNGTPSGLTDVISGDAILLRVTGSGDIEGYVSSSPATVAFLIDLNTDTGAITLTQNRAITHNDPADPLETFASGSAAHMASGLIVLTATIEDSDADTASATANIGGSFQFEDDGPSIDRSANAVPTLVTDDTDTPGDTASASFASLFTAGDFGKDGFKDSDDNNVEDADAIRYALSITGGNGTPSGLTDTLTGDAILLRVNGSGDIEGYLSSAPGTIAFLIDLNLDTGSVQLTQNRAIVHDNPNDSVETGNEASHMASGLIVLTATIEDGDGDTDTATANIGDAFHFEDDGPTAAVSTAGFSISHDETPGLQDTDVAGPLSVFATVTNTGDDPDVLPNGAGSVIGFATSTGAISSSGSSFGKDGFKDADDNDVQDSDAVVFSLNISNPLGTDSGLNVTGGQDIILFKEGDLIVGRVSGGAFNGQAAFAIAINSSTGQMSMVQYLSIQHG